MRGIIGDTGEVLRVVLDTSVLVAAWRSSLGASFELVHAIGGGAFEIAVSVSLVAEYESALLRHLSGRQRARHVHDLIDHVCAVAVQQKIFFLWRPLLPDPNDDMVVEVAMASQSAAIVTHNLRHFAAAERLGLSVLAPGAFLNQLLKR